MLLKEIFLNLRKKQVVFREINGVSLEKKEIVLSKIVYQEVRTEIRVKFEPFVENMLECRSRKNSLRENIYLSLKEDVLQNRDENYFKIMDYLLNEAVYTTSSELSFTRFYRELGELIKQVKQRNFQILSDKNPQSYSCYVYPGRKLKSMQSEIFANMATAISSRMIWNSWHFFPGNLTKDQIDVKNRDFYYPPIFLDTSIHDKYHHVGHMKLSIDNCIRSPQSIILEGKEYKALTDLRLLRVGGLPFSTREVCLALGYSEFIALTNQVLIDLIEEYNLDYALPKFTKQWYQKKVEEENQK